MIKQNVEENKFQKFGSWDLIKSNIAGMFSFLLVFFLFYSLIDHNLFEYRDDGVITMSVAKNIVEYGFIGVSPSGPIVEASSSPLQVFVYAIIYYITGIKYSLYSWVQTLFCTAAIGYVFGAFFAEKNIKTVTIYSISAAIVLSLLYPFFLWHASGMENALTHVFYIVTIYIIYKSVKDEYISMLYAIPMFFASITRVESIVHIALLLIVFAVFWRIQFNNNRAFFLGFWVLFLWAMVNFGRYVYFGDWKPNTAYAQGISVRERLIDIINLNYWYIISSFKTIGIVFLKQGWWLLFFAIPLIFKIKKEKTTKVMILAILCVSFTIIFSPLIFGQARIDPARTTTQLTLIVVVAIFYLTSRIDDQKWLSSYLIKAIPLVGCLYVIAYAGPKIIGLSTQGMGPYYLGWSTNGFNNVRKEFEKLALENNIKRATVSNPDLGVMTWYKQFNVVDLGMLGTPEMAKLKNSPALNYYFLGIALPDFIESHDWWTRRYCKSIFMHDWFSTHYEMIGRKDDTFEICNQQDLAPMRYWVRKDIKISSPSRERVFLDVLQSGFSIEHIVNELSHCSTERIDCGYVSRTVFRFLPEIEAMGEYDKVSKLFQSDLDLAIISSRSNPLTQNTIINSAKRLFLEDVLSGVNDANIVFDGVFNVHLNKKYFIFIRDNCEDGDLKDPFYLHVYPVNRSDLVSSAFDFNNLDFRFDGHGVRVADKCVALRYIPQYAIKSFSFGQYVPKGSRLWGGSVSLDQVSPVN